MGADVGVGNAGAVTGSGLPTTAANATCDVGADKSNEGATGMLGETLDPTGPSTLGGKLSAKKAIGPRADATPVLGRGSGGTIDTNGELLTSLSQATSRAPKSSMPLADETNGKQAVKGRGSETKGAVTAGSVLFSGAAMLPMSKAVPSSAASSLGTSTSCATSTSMQLPRFNCSMNFSYSEVRSLSTAANEVPQVSERTCVLSKLSKSTLLTVALSSFGSSIS